MAGISVHYDIQTAIAGLLADSPPDGLLPQNIRVRELPKVGEVLDALPCLIIAPDRNIAWEPIGFEGAINRTYGVWLAVIAANNDDYATNQEKYQGWLEAAARTACPVNLQDTTPDVPSVWRIVVDTSATFDTAKLSELYAYQTVLLRFDSQETRN